MILDGKLVSKKILDDVKESVFNLNRKLGLSIILIGDIEAGRVYVKQKEKMAKFLDYNFSCIHLDGDVSQNVVIDLIDKLNCDSNVDGIMVQMPLPKHIDADVVLNRILPSKDVDGLSQYNVLNLENGNPKLVPCTAIGVIDLLDYYNIEIKNKNVVIIGRSRLVGKPLAHLFKQRGANVNVCHTKTDDLVSVTRKADILVVAIGKANFVTSDMVSDGVIIVDVGINVIDGKLVGDVDYYNVFNKCSYITPVPGGVGPMTVSELGKNVYLAYKLRNK